MDMPKYVLTISGSDSSGRAGMQTDNRAIHACGGYPLNVLTAVTVQGPTGVESVELMSADFVEQQLRSMLKSYPVKAIKSGMLGNADIVLRVAQVLSEYPEVPYVLDPVICSSSQAVLLEPAGVKFLRSLLMPRAILTTPNLDEVKLLSGFSDDVWEAGAKLAKGSGQVVLLKGGHASTANCDDWLFYPDGGRSCHSVERIQTNNSRGTGCALSSLIAAHLAREPCELERAIRAAKDQLSCSLYEHRNEAWQDAGPSFL